MVCVKVEGNKGVSSRSYLHQTIYCMQRPYKLACVFRLWQHQSHPNKVTQKWHLNGTTFRNRLFILFILCSGLTSMLVHTDYDNTSHIGTRSHRSRTTFTNECRQITPLFLLSPHKLVPLFHISLLFSTFHNISAGRTLCDEEAMLRKVGHGCIIDVE